MAHWPQPGDSLFGRDGASERTHVIFQNPFDHGFLYYARSYIEAADVVVEDVRVGTTHPDVVSYAVLYLYRHYVELMLKGLISLGTALEEGQASYPTNEHGLKVLWDTLRPLLERTFPDGDKSTTQAVEGITTELNLLDPDGQTFRYFERRRKDGSGQRIPLPTLPDDSQCAYHLDLENIRRVIGRVAGYLEGSYDEMDELLKFQADVDSENQG